MTTTLVSVRYPLTETSQRTIRRGLEYADDDDGSLIVLHVSLLQNRQRLARKVLQSAVEREFGTIPAHYIVRQGYVLEEAIIDEAARQEANRVIIGKTKRGRIKRRLGHLLRLYPDLKAALERNLDATLIIVD